MIPYRNLVITASTVGAIIVGLAGAVKAVEYFGFNDKFFVTNERLEKVVENLQQLPLLNNSTLLKLKRAERRQIQDEIDSKKTRGIVIDDVYFQQKDALDAEILYREQIETNKPEG